ncbi:MAG TPA: lipid-A-disaccharide synthase N-terminal domain-containing protein [Amaricoccus sp.]|nr:lipid-A-disaccharide synthase N-terminal domain-containing protein [Amaricoccus sp.]
MKTLFEIFRVDHWGEFWWVVVGLAGQLMFSMRFLIQWISSERARKSVMPVAFWYFSLAGGAILLTYAIYRRDPVFILGQATGLFIYSRNLWLIRAEKRAP